MESVINAIGLTSSILISIMFVPQVVHVYRTKDTHAINYAFLNLNMLASSLGLVYSVYFNIVPMIVANTSAGLFSVSLACMKFINGLKEETTDDTISEAPIV
jgi:MtN3 and saliva related transmembrane protein